MEYTLFQDEDILERVDEYTLYCHYLGFEPLIGGRYKSPIRQALDKDPDDNPSFGIYEAKTRKFGNHEYVWKDHAANKGGNIFKLVQILFGFETKFEAFRKVLADFGISGETDISVPRYKIIEPRFADPVDIDICSKPFTERDYAYWRQFNVSKEILGDYFVKSIKHYWISKDQKNPSYPKGLGYAYQIWDKYQLYFPHAPKKDKFRNNWIDSCIPGYLQLKYDRDLCIITKAMKDVMCLRSFGYEAVSPRGESIMLPSSFLEYLKTRYKKILVLFDTDGKHKGDEYPFEKIYVLGGEKDISDHCKVNGPMHTAELLTQLISEV
jgi:hypothetical protein